MRIWDILERTASLHPGRVGIVDGDRQLTYRQVYQRVVALAAYLRDQGITAGDRISILGWNCLEFYETYFAAAAIGAILNPLNVRLSAAELTTIVDDAGSRLLFADRSFAVVVDEVNARGTTLERVVWFGDGGEYDAIVSQSPSSFEPHRASADDVVHLYYTSGTTGRAKGVMLTERNVTTHALGTIAELRLADSDRWAHIAPMFHLADAWATFAITWCGGTHLFLPRFDAERALDLFEQQRVTITNLIPTMLNLMVNHPSAIGRDYSSLRSILSGGAPIAPEVVRKIVERFGCEYVQTYGMTETSPYLTLSLLKDELKTLTDEEQLKYRSKTGRPFITVQLNVVREDGREVAPDGVEVGEILARGDTVTPGYWNRPEETRAAFVDGWLRTGDLAVVDEHGYLDIVDRKKDMIITGGENVYCTEVENVLYRHPAVLEAAVFGRPDELYGEVVAAALVLRSGVSATGEEIASYCRQFLAGYKTPREIVFLDELPRTGSGKIYKQGLKRGMKEEG